MTPVDFDDCFETLGLAPGASWETVRARYRRLLFLHHPDRTDDAGARERFEAITRAYQMLCEAFVKNGPGGPNGRCEACGDVAELTPALDGNHYCPQCVADRPGRRGLPAPPITVVSCAGVIGGLLAAAVLLGLGLRGGSPTYLVTSMVLSALSLGWLMVLCLTIRYTVGHRERKRRTRAGLRNCESRMTDRE